jgi:P-type E1-E2 ATPase
MMMIEIDVPGRGVYCIAHLVLDVNGTIVVAGELVEGVKPRVDELRDLLEVYMLTADTRGRQGAIDEALGFEGTRIAPQGETAQKATFVQDLGGDNVCAIGNGANDAHMLSEAGLAIAVLGGEGLALETLNAADVVAPHINAALDLLLNPLRLVATLRR